MNTFKKYALMLGMAAMLSTSANVLNADTCGSNDCGVAYEDCCSAPCISPTLVLGVLVVGGLVAVLVNSKSIGHGGGHGGNGGGGNAHGHSH